MIKQRLCQIGFMSKQVSNYFPEFKQVENLVASYFTDFKQVEKLRLILNLSHKRYLI